jgi:hypothetical protein
MFKLNKIVPYLVLYIRTVKTISLRQTELFSLKTIASERFLKIFQDI